jgi:hypothetical protein
MGLIIVYLDIKKAFDSVPHLSLLHTLAQAGITGTLLNWFDSYLNNRTQITKISGCTSASANITSGVIQGSVLGPILFLIYINSALHQIKYGEPFLFADDIKIVYAIHRDNPDKDFRAIQLDLDALSIWSNTSGLHFSAEKSFILTSGCPMPPHPFLLCTSTLRIASETRDLGIRYTRLFNFSAQAEYQIAKARQLSFYILRSFNLPMLKLAIYKQRIRPILEYCPMVYQHYTQQARHAIEGIQRLFTRNLSPEGHTKSYRERCIQYNLDPLWMRRLKLNLKLLHQLIYSQAHTAVARPTFTHSDYHMRNSTCKVQCETSRTTFRHNFFLSFYSRLWNKLPESVRCLENEKHFYSSLHNLLSLSTVEELFSTMLSLDDLCKLGPRNV